MRRSRFIEALGRLSILECCNFKDAQVLKYIISYLPMPYLAIPVDWLATSFVSVLGRLLQAIAAADQSFLMLAKLAPV